MHRSKRFTLTTALVALAALLALVVGGTASAADSGGPLAHASALSKRQIVKLVKKEAKKAAKRNPGPQGPPGPAGSPGPAGPAGPAGSAGIATQKFACKTNIGISDPSCGTIYNQDGLRFQADCTNNGLAVRTTQEHAVMTLFAVDLAGAAFASITDSASNSGFVLTSPNGPGTSGVATYTPSGSGTVITVNYSATFNPGMPQGDCVFMGTIVRAA